MNKLKKAISVFILSVMIGVGAYGAVKYDSSAHNTTGTRENLVLGPRINVDPPIARPENETITLQIFSEIPSALPLSVSGFYHSGHSLIGLNASSNPYYDQLLNVTFNSTHASFFLTPEFYDIATLWSQEHPGRHNVPSMTVQASKTVWNSTSISVYNYYNNLPYMPWKIPNTEKTTNLTSISSYLNDTGINSSLYGAVTYSPFAFNVSLQFPSTPTQVVLINGTSSTVDTGMTNATKIIPDTTYYHRYYTTTGTSSNTYTSQTGINETVAAFPFMTVHISNSTLSNGKSLLVLGSDIQLENTSIGINSDNTYSPSSGQVSTTMSVNNSEGYITDNNASSSKFLIGANNWPVYPYALEKNLSNASMASNRTTGYVALENATYLFSHYNKYMRTTTTTYHWEQTYYYEPGKGYVFEPPVLQYTTSSSSTSYIGHGTVGEITSLQSRNGSLEMAAGWLPPAFNTVLQHMYGTGTYAGSFDLNTSATRDQSTAWDQNSAYSTSSEEIKLANEALTAFPLELGAGLALTDTLAAANVLGEAAEPEIVTLSLEYISLAAGVAAAVLGYMGSISFLAQSSIASLSTLLTNAPLSGSGSNYVISYYQNSAPVSFTYDGTTYAFNMPMDYYNATNYVT